MPTAQRLPQQIISADAWAKMQYACRYDPSLEVQWYGRTTVYPESNIVYVDDIYIPEQVVGGAHTRPDESTMPTFWAWLADRDETPDMWRHWGHSHDTMAAFASGTDEGTLDLLASDFHSTWFGLVTNVKGERFSWMSSEFEGYRMRSEIPCSINWEVPDIKANIEALMKERVKRTAVVTTGPNSKTPTGTTTPNHQPGFHSEYGSFVNGVWVAYSAQTKPESETEGKTSKIVRLNNGGGGEPVVTRRQRRRQSRKDAAAAAAAIMAAWEDKANALANRNWGIEDQIAAAAVLGKDFHAFTEEDWATLAAIEEASWMGDGGVE